MYTLLSSIILLVIPNWIFLGGGGDGRIICWGWKRPGYDKVISRSPVSNSKVIDYVKVYPIFPCYQSKIKNKKKPQNVRRVYTLGPWGGEDFLK